MNFFTLEIGISSNTLITQWVIYIYTHTYMLLYIVFCTKLNKKNDAIFHLLKSNPRSQFFFLILDCTPIIELSIVVEPYQSHSGITLLMTSSGNNISIKLININIQVINLDFLFQYFDFFLKKRCILSPTIKIGTFDTDIK